MAEPEMVEPEQPAWTRTNLFGIAAVRDLVWIAFGVLLVLIAYWLRDVLAPFLAAFAVAYVFKPAVDWAEDRWGVPRVVSSATVVLLALGALAGGLVYFAPLIYEQSLQLIRKVPEYLLALAEEFGIDSEQADDGLRGALLKVRDDPSSLAGMLSSAGANAVGWMGRFVSATTYLATAAVIVPIYAFYFAWRYDSFLHHVRRLVPAGQRRRVLERMTEFDETFGRWVRARIGIGLIQVVLFCIGFWWAEIPFWFLLGVLTGLLCIVPIIGFVGWPLAILAKAMNGGDLMEVVVWPSVVYGAIQCLETFVLSPLIEAKSLHISPFMVLFAIVVGGSVGGFFGVLLAVPLANCISMVYAKDVRPRLDQWSKGES